MLLTIIWLDSFLTEAYLILLIVGKNIWQKRFKYIRITPYRYLQLQAVQRRAAAGVNLQPVHSILAIFRLWGWNTFATWPRCRFLIVQTWFWATNKFRRTHGGRSCLSGPCARKTAFIVSWFALGTRFDAGPHCSVKATGFTSKFAVTDNPQASTDDSSHL